MVELLLEYGADVNFESILGETPLHCAARVRDFRIIELLLEKNVDVNAGNPHGCTPLWSLLSDIPVMESSSEEVQEKDLASIELLLRGGANLRCKSDEISFLCKACEWQDSSIFLLLLTFSTGLTEDERGVIGQFEKFSKYLSTFEKIKGRFHINNFLEMFISGDEVEKFKSQEKLFIQDLSEVRPRDEDEFLVFKYIYYLISCVKDECLIHYNLTFKDKLFATGALAGIIRECLHQRGKDIDLTTSLKKHGYGLERYKPVLSSISKTTTASAEAYSELHWKKEVNESVSYLLECAAICNVNEENQEVRNPHYDFGGSHGGCSITSSQNSRPSESVNQADNQPDSRLSDINVHGLGMSRQNY